MPWVHPFREHGWSGVIIDVGLTARSAAPSHWSRAAAAVEKLDFGTFRSSASVGHDRHGRVWGDWPGAPSDSGIHTRMVDGPRLDHA